MVSLLDRAGRVPVSDAMDLACRDDLALWTEYKLGLRNAPVHDEWCDLAQTASRLCVVAPREFAKSQTFTVNATSHDCRFRPGFWTYVFCETMDQAREQKQKIDDTIGSLYPWMITGAHKRTAGETIYANYSRVTVAGAGKRVRGAHPDRIVGDDVLSETGTATALQRRKTHRWWFGAVANMAHPGVTRPLGSSGAVVTMPATRIHLVGTPFHQSDLLMSMRSNPIYTFRRYAAEYRPEDLADGYAVEVA